MPTENRSSNTEMVSVPRGTVENAAELLQEYNKCSIARDLRALLAQPADQHQGEPVGEVVAFGKGLHEIAWAAGRMPKLGAKLYTSADPAEVERLRDENRRLHEAGEFLDGVSQGIEDKLRAQLAERDALLREIHDGTLSGYARYSKIEAVLSVSAEPCAPVMQIPEGYCVMPRRLTAENGAKALLLGEFKLEVTQECPECRELDEPIEGCEICDGEGEYGQCHMIPWDKIKFIYSVAVKGLALKP
ncbi:MAG: hypothetical protein ACN6P0_12440 [Pseudomonas capeferrum]|uniref:hypothetical protein n=1 Tax=Pseudomonas capeferrum TaxID=1495066 RepID=UPI003D146B88